MSGTALEAVAGSRSRDLGSDHSPGRLLCSLQGLSSSPFSHPGIVSDIPGRLSLGSSLAARGQGDACQRSLRNRPRSGSRLLQSPLPCGESFWRLETRDRSLTPERLRPADVVQVGNSRFCTVICQRGGFSSFPGSERCVFSDPDPSIFREAIEVHVGGDGLPVPSSVLRTIDRSPGVHQSLRGRVGVGTLPRDQTSPVSGRLVGPLLLGAGGQAGHPVASLGLSRASCRDRVVSPPSGGEITTSYVGQSVDKSLCDVPQRETAPVLLASPGPTGRSPGVHQSLRGRVGVGTLPRDQTSPVSGRLVGPLLLGAGGQAGHPVASLGLSLASCRDRVVSPPSGGEITTSYVGQSVDKSLCDVPQRETAPVLLASPGPTGRLPGCVSPSLGRPGPVCIPEDSPILWSVG